MKTVFSILCIVTFVFNSFSQSISDYVFTSTTGTYTEVTGGTASTVSGDDGTQTALPIGFTFNYCGQNYTTFNTTTNGCIYFGTSFSYTNDLASTSYVPVIACLWDDLYDDANSEVRYILTGTAPNRVLTVQWKNILWGRYTTGTAVPTYRQNFQIILHETTNVIEFLYGDMQVPGTERTASASIGLNNTPGGSGKFLSVTPGASPTVSSTVANNSINAITNLTNGLLYRFTPSSCTSPTALTAANITTNSADLSWTSTGTLFNVQYGLSGFILGSGTIENGITSTTYNATGLNSSSTYQFYVQNDCGAEQSNWSGPFSFNTMCDATTATVIQNFDAVTTPNIPNCWSKIVVGSSGTPTITTITTTPYSSPNCVQMYNATSVGSSTHLLLISPQFSDLSSGGKQVRFRAKFSGTGTPVMHVGTMSNATDQNSFTIRQTYMDLTTNWQEYVISFDTYTGSDQYIAIKHGLGTTNQYIYIDNFTWEPIPSCPWPTAFQVSGIQDVQATFNWTEMGSAAEWQVEYGSTGHTAGSGTKVLTTTNPFTVTGLTSQTAYDFYVRAICGPGDTSAWTGPISLTTTCSLVSVFTENFDAVTTPAFPSCWFKVGTAGSAYTQTTSPNSTPNCLYIYSSSTSSLAVVSMPPVNNAGANTHQLRFKARANFTVGGIIQVGYLTNPSDPATFVNIQAITIPALTYQEFIVYPGTSVGSNTTLAFRHTGAPANSVLIDDVYWELRPSCPPPVSLTASGITGSSATLGWTSTGTETEWDIQYGVTGFALGSGTIVQGVTNPYTVNGLLPSTTYQFYVLAQCSPTDSSAWTGPYSFTTPCMSISTFPWTEGFESVTIPALPNCWYKENGDWLTTNNANTTYDADAHSGAQFLREAYSATNEYIWTPGFDVVAGQSYDFTFWWAGDTYSGWTGDIFRNSIQSSIGSTQIGASFLASTTTTSFTYKQEKITYVPASSGVVYFAIRVNCPTSTPWYLSFDDFRFELTPTCPRPSALNASNATQTTCDLNWTPGGTETSWDIQYGVSGFALGTGTIVQNVTNPYTVTGLTPSTTYQYYVLAQCSSSDSSTWEGPYSFTTLCGPVTATYVQNFDGVTTPNLPNCWNKIVIGSGGTPTITTVTTTPYSTPNCVQMYNATSVGSATHLLLISPQFSDIASGGKQVRFRAKMTGSGTPVLHVGTMTDPTNQTTFTSMQTFMDLTTNWQEYVISFDTYTGSNQYIAIKHGLGTTNQYIYIDNFTWEPIPSCPWPTAFAATNVQDVQTTFNWTEMGSATEWQIDYGTAAHVAGTGTHVNGITSKPYTVTGLTATTAYAFYVRAICGPGDTSAWTGPVNITTACSPVSSLPWTEGFETVTIPAYPSCWFEENGDWVTTNNANSTYDADAHSGGQFLRETYSATNEYMWTCGFYLTGGESYDFKFWWAGDNYTGWAGEVFTNTAQISTGATQLGTPFVLATDATTKTYQQEKYTFIPSTTGIYYFGIRINCPSAPWYISFDDFSLTLTPQYDLAVEQLISPSSQCNLTSTEDISISVTNYGTLTVTNPDFSYKINNGTVVTETYTGTIDPMQTITYTFTTQADFSNYGTLHNIKAWSVYASDPNTLNDTLNTSITPIANVTTLTEPFTTFSNGYTPPFPNGWEVLPATGYNWQISAGTTSTTLTGPNADHTTGSGKYIYTEADNGTVGNTTTLTTTCLDLSSFTLPRLSFWYHFYGADIDRMYVEVFASGNWVKIDSIVGQQQTTETAAWLRRINALTVPGIEKIRFRAVRGVGYYGDLAIDDILIEESPTVDLRVKAWISPVYTGCGSSGIDQIHVSVQNMGVNPVTNPGMAYQVNGGALVRDTLYATIASGAIDTMIFTQPYDFSLPGSYVVKAFIDETTDTDNTNDTLAMLINVTPMVNTYPYVDNFEGAGSYWISGGTLNSWQHGVPAGTTINTAASGTQAWMTGLTGAYNNNEASWVQGPCFDFSTIVNPIVTIMINVDAESSYDGAQLQYSVDAGSTWTTLGAYNDFYNWYNDNTTSGLSWTGVSEGWTGTDGIGWQLTGHSLSNLVGEPDVRFRMAFGSDGSVNSYDGFAFDNFTITQAADLKTIAPATSYTECDLDPDTIRLYVKNVGPVTVTTGETINMKYKINTLPLVTEPYVLTADLVTGDSILYTFTTPYTFTAGTHTVKLIADLVSDMNANNDTAQYTITKTTIAVDIMGGDTMHINPAYLPYTLSLINLGYTYDSYQWSNFDGSVTGTSAQYNATTLGWYYVTVTIGTCSAVDSILLDDLVSASINSAGYGMQLFPNPASSTVNFNAHFRNITDIELQIMSVDGKVIESRNYKNSAFVNDPIDVTAYARGIYYIKIIYDNSTYIDKISLE